ncbi:MAG TPA: SDR family oxidoreductase [Solirubrobacterales bacterium]|nr:SDR family oxidoreductase [Solirubrobacterales bacterium]
MAERYDIRGKVVLITGAARGIGADAAQRLAKRGAQVSLVGLEPELLREVAEGIGSNAAWFEADVTDLAALTAAVDATVERFGGIDVVIANAGIAPFGTVATIDPAAFEKTIEVNVIGVWRTVRAALPHVIARRGYILPIASLAAALHPPMMAHYTASKAAVEAFADALRSEIAHTGTRVGVAYFSFIDTDMVRGTLTNRAADMMRDATPGPFGKTAPLSAAGRAIERGIERRANKVYAPRWVLPMTWLRGIMQPLTQRSNRETIAEAVKVAEADAAAEAQQPVAAQRSA